MDCEYTDSNIVESAAKLGNAVAEPRKNPHEHGRAYVIVRTADGGTKLEYLERPPFPPRRTGTVKLTTVDSFLEYWKRQADSDSYVYGSMAPAQFLAVFDEHSKEQPDWRGHRCLFTLEHSKEFKEWSGRNRQPFQGNDKFLEWLQDNGFDVVQPEPSKFMDIANNLRINQAQSFGKAVNLGDGNVEMEYTNAVDASTKDAAGKKVKIPEQFAIDIPVFSGIDAWKYRFEARFRFRLGGGAVTLWYELVRPHKVVEKAFKDLLERIQKDAKTSVLWGTPE